MARKKKNKVEVYSEDDDFFEEEETLLPEEQLLYLSIDRKMRKGKHVTLVENFIGAEDDLKDLAKNLKSTCGVGGSVKEGIIIIQGEFRDKIKQQLEKIGYKTKLKGG